MLSLINEGIIRGIATIPYRRIQEIKRTSIDLLKIWAKSENKIKYIRKVLKDIRAKFNNMNIDLSKDNQHQIIDILSRLNRWRYYVIFNDEKYKKIINDILNDKNGKNYWIDISFAQRKIEQILQIQNNKDVNDLIDKYDKRITEIETLIKKYPDKEKEFNKLLVWGIVGLSDFFNVVHAIISYGSSRI